MKTIRLIGSAAGMLLIALVMSTGAAHAQTLGAAGPHCPDRAPLAARYLSTTFEDGRYYDFYLVPFFLGFKTERVACPA
jgi:hypothetical protein